MTTKIKCPVCNQYFESQYITKRYWSGGSGAVMCDLCYDHCVDYGDKEVENEDD